MYENITSLLPKMRKSNYGKFVVDTENYSAPYHLKQTPYTYILYEDLIWKLQSAVFEFHEQHPEFGLNEYNKIVREHHLGYPGTPIDKADVTTMDGQLILSLLIGLFSRERFCDGVILDYCKNGCVIKWLERLVELDANS